MSVNPTPTDDNIELRVHDELQAQFGALNRVVDKHSSRRPQQQQQQMSQGPSSAGSSTGSLSGILNQVLGGTPSTNNTQSTNSAESARNTANNTSSSSPPPALNTTTVSTTSVTGPNAFDKQETFCGIPRYVWHERRKAIASGVFVVIFAIIIAVIVVSTRGSSSSSGGSYEADAYKGEEGADGGGELAPPPGDEAASEAPGGVAYSVDDHAVFRYKAEVNFPHWKDDHAYVYTGSDQALYAHDISEDRKYIAIPADIMTKYEVEYVQFSPDGSRALMQSEVQPVFKYSERSVYRVYNLKTKTVYRLKPLRLAGGEGKLYAAEWSPKSNGVAYVYRTQLYYQQLPVKKNTPPILIRSYPDKLHGTVFVGMADWAYEEDVFFGSKAMAFNEDGTKLAFAVVYDVNVQSVSIPKYGDRSTFYQYSQTLTLKYPKAGTFIPQVRLYVKNLDPNATALNDTGVVATVEAPASIKRGSGLILMKFAWQPAPGGGNLIVVWMNRAQNTSWYTSCSEDSAHKWNCEILHVNSPKNGWVLITKGITFDSTGSWFIDIFPRGEKSVYGLFKINAISGRTVPMGSANVVPDQFGVLHWYNNPSWVFYAGVPAMNITQSHIYKVSPEPSKPEHHCLTCLLKNSRGETCTYNLASFSPNGKYFAISCEAIFSPPQTAIYEMESFRKVVVLNENLEIDQKVKHLELPTVKDFGPLSLGRYKGKIIYGTARMFIPPDVVLNDGAKVPLVIHCYGAPDHKLITDAYLFNSNAEGLSVALAASHRIAVALIDVRGSAYRPVDEIFAVKNSLGTKEVDDQLSVIGALIELPFVDQERVSVWGWSYGGFIAGSALMRDNQNIIKCGVLVSPVVNWLYYNAMYVEKYMGLPQDFPEVYQSSDLASKPYLFRNKTLMIIHGTADNNVHYQNSMALVEALQEEGILFRQQTYPDEPHEFTKSRLHLFRTMLDFWVEDCFDEFD